MNQLNKRYEALNASFHPALIYHTGIDAGFFAEYNTLLHALLYALQRRWQLKLYADDANFGYDRGWTDYFLPFCPLVHEGFHRVFNLYRLPSWSTVCRKALRKGGSGLLRWKLKASCRHLAGDVLAWRAYGQRTLLSQHVRFNPHAHFRIPELGIDGDYLEAYRVADALAWRLNEPVGRECRRLEEALHLPPRYAGCQIRGGDKVMETRLLPPEHYVSLLRRHAPGQDVFVLTDDYRLFRRLQSLAPEVRWHTLCTPDEQGYVNRDFARSGGEAKRAQMVRFLASIEILKRSSLFVGSITPGPSLYLSKLLYPRIRPADCRPEDFPTVCRLPIAERTRWADRYLAGGDGL